MLQFFLASFLLFQAGVQEGQGEKPGERGGQKKAAQAEPPVIPTDRRVGAVLELGLSDCLALGATRNVDIALKELGEKIARQDEILDQSVYDFEFFLGSDYSRSESPSLNSFQPSLTRKLYSLTAGVRKKILTGATLEVAFSPSYLEQKVASVFAFPTDVFRGEAKVSLTQPLLRGAWWDYHLATLEIREKEVQAQNRETLRTRQEVLDATVAAYFDLVYAREDWRVKFESLELAREQLDITNKKIKLGELAPRDRVSFEADVSTREEELIRAENLILDAEDALKRLILPFEGERDWEFVIKPTERLGEEDPDFPVPDWKQASLISRRLRPDLEAARKRVEQAGLRAFQSERDLWPQLDLIASYSTDSQRDDFNALQKDIFGDNFPDLAVGLNLDIPIGNRSARSRYRRARLEEEQSRRTQRILEIEIDKEIRETIRSLETLKKTITAARESVRLATTNLETEKIRLALDTNTQLDVQIRNNELSNARSRLIRARLDFRRAWFRLLSVQGALGPDSTLPLMPGRKKEPGVGKGNETGRESPVTGGPGSAMGGG